MLCFLRNRRQYFWLMQTSGSRYLLFVLPPWKWAPDLNLCDGHLVYFDFLWFLYYCWSVWCNGGVQVGQKSLWSNICIWPLQDIKLANWPRRNVKVAKLKYLCSGNYKNIRARNPFKNSNFGEERKIVAGKFNLLAPAGSEGGRWTEFTFIFYLIFHSTFFSSHRIFSKVFVIQFGIKVQTAEKLLTRKGRSTIWLLHPSRHAMSS